MEFKKKFFEEVERRFKELGFDVEEFKYEEDKYTLYKIIDPTNNEEMSRVLEDGGTETFTKYRRYSNLFCKMASEIAEYTKCYCNGESLGGSLASYKKIFEYNNAILAIKQRQDKSYEFATWSKAVNGRGVCYGHYFTDFRAAKKDMVDRSNLINKEYIFNEEQLKTIYMGLGKYAKSRMRMPSENSKKVDKILQKIRLTYPDIEEDLLKNEENEMKEYLEI